MHKIVIKAGIATLAACLASAAFAADKRPEQVKVEASRVVTKDAGFAASGARIQKLSLSYEVSLDDIDVTTKDGFATAEKRINAAADQACKEISKQAQEATPSDSACTREAATTSLRNLKALIAANAKAAGK